MTWYVVYLGGREVAGFPFMTTAILYVFCMDRPDCDQCLEAAFGGIENTEG